MQHGLPATNSSQRLVSLDLLRFLAAMAVVFYHYTYRGTVAEPMSVVGFDSVTFITRFGYLGVDLFFILSGFVIAWSAERQNIWQFVRGRALRLYPAYVIGASLTLALTMWLGGRYFDASLAQWAANLIFFPQVLGHDFIDGAYWSIAVEIIFYGWVALFLATGLFNRALTAILAIWLVISVLNQFWLMNKALEIVFITAYSGFFIVGILFFRSWRCGRLAPTERIVLILAMAIGVWCEADKGLAWADAATAANLQWVLVLTTLSLFAVFQVFLRWQPNRSVASLFVFLGSVSYPLYLIHQHIGYMLLDHLVVHVPASVALIAVVTAVLLVSAAIAWLAEPLMRAVMRILLDAVLGLLQRGVSGRWPNNVPAHRIKAMVTVANRV